MSRFDNFVRLVQAEATVACITRPQPPAGVRPAAILSVAMQCPMQVLAPTTEGLRFQAEELIDWFFGGPDPEWLPESLMFEEVEELVEEFVEEGEEFEDDDDYEYEMVEEYNPGGGY
ncbi:MAG: hypothetical protein KC800_10515 [Candidatus Eremiobacteraeota bacterium]|nr:hypothetical protein [Candidatus Eremiobacteraeota bacterium]